MDLELYNNKLVKDFILAGNATITVVSKKSNKHLTFKIKKAKKGKVVPYFVSLLNGGDDRYEYLGCIWKKNNLEFSHGKKSRIKPDSDSSKLMNWVVGMINHNKELAEKCVVLRDNRCGRCGRKLTNPKSIVTGIGPECSKRIWYYYK